MSNSGYLSVPAEKMYAKNKCAPPSGHLLQKFCPFANRLPLHCASVGRKCSGVGFGKTAAIVFRCCPSRRELKENTTS
jgi:hypothetical protein